MPVVLFRCALEISQNTPGIHEAMPDPFDITNHGGNMWAGVIVAAGVALTYAVRNNINPNNRQMPVISEETMSRFRKFGIATIVGTTALINCTTETKWGVQHLPIAEWTHGKTPDDLDTLYSTAWSGIMSLAFWKKKKLHKR